MSVDEKNAVSPTVAVPGITHRAGVVDALCNAFMADRRPLWEDAIAATGVQVKIRRSENDGPTDPETMVRRMDEVGVATLLLPTCDIETHGAANLLDYEPIACRWEEVESLAHRWPGRFAALAVIDPTKGIAGVRSIRARLADPWVVGLYVHTHSWDRRFDHADYYPYYMLCSDLGVPVQMQAGTSGGLLASECGKPLGIDRAALYFPETRFVLSHTGWPWVAEAVAMALKFPNVYLGTGAYPPRHWEKVLIDFIRGPGRSKVLFGTNFPTVGHRHALGQLDELGLSPAIEQALLSGTARSVFSRLSDLS